MSNCFSHFVGISGVLTLSGATAGAANLDVRVTSGGSSTVEVTPCSGAVDYEITGVLSDVLNEGLAGFAFDLAFSGGPLGPADAPSGGPMLNFDRPAGATGPDGFGGTVVNGRLVRVGGAQNTVKNTADHAPFPIGSVIPGVAQTEVVLVTGSFTAPVEPGTYTLVLSNLSATVIRQGEDGSGVVWAVEPAGVGTITNLTVIVPSASPPATAANSGPVCPSQNVTLLGGPDGMAGYLWTGPDGFTSTQQNPIVFPAVRGTYTLTVTDANNCRDTARTTVDFMPGPCEPLVDCNSNGIHDVCDIATGTSQDTDADGMPDECEANWVSAVPANQKSLWRTAHNVIRLTFDKDITAPGAGSILIQQMLDGGAFGPDLVGSFSFAVEDVDIGGGVLRPRVLRIQETGATTVLTHRTWIAIRNAGTPKSRNAETETSKSQKVETETPERRNAETQKGEGEPPGEPQGGGASLSAAGSSEGEPPGLSRRSSAPPGLDLAGRRFPRAGALGYPLSPLMS